MAAPMICWFFSTSFIVNVILGDAVLRVVT
jgi:hypothetical protein